MNLDLITEFLVKSVVKEKDMVSVKQYEEDELITIEVLASKDDMPSLIGKQGVIAKAIRTLVIASACTQENHKTIKINFNSI